MLESLNFPELLILILLGALFFKEQMSNALATWLHGKRESPSDESVPEWATQLLQHFNHDTTAQHDLTHAKLDRIESKVDRHNELELGNSGKLEEIIRIVNR